MKGLILSLLAVSSWSVFAEWRPVFHCDSKDGKNHIVFEPMQATPYASKAIATLNNLKVYAVKNQTVGIGNDIQTIHYCFAYKEDSPCDASSANSSITFDVENHRMLNFKTEEINVNCLDGRMESMEIPEVRSTIIDRKTKNQLEIGCSDAECTGIEFYLRKKDSLEHVASYSQEQFLNKVDKISELDKATLDKHFFHITQMIAKLPWQDSEFRRTYFILFAFSFPLTAVGVGIDVALTPVSLVSYVGDSVNGNAGKQLLKSYEHEMNKKVSHSKFMLLVNNLRKTWVTSKD